ncbi:UNVERIFIED_CONTAM: hypothetical protein Sradi_7296400 [Sesamum radiatum]|uniref:Retroviral polymerase SH3-like domain-containing protein n=1 Tax=Sesamum radiatum TaxID=300843 RepID=A0AAW2IJE6_SESRA
MKEIYAVPDRHIRYATTKALFGSKMAEGSSVQSHEVKMLSLVEKLEDLKAGLENDTYIDVILHSLHLSYDPFIVNYHMNGLENCGAHICNKLQVLERSRKLSKDEMILRLGDGKVVAAEAVGSLSLVVSDHIRIELKDCFYVPNVCRPLNTMARGRFSYFITFTDDHSRYGYVFLIRYKTEAFERFKEYRLEVENQTGHKIKDYTLETATKLLNIAPSKRVPQTPYEIWHGKPASYKYLRVWGKLAYVKRLVGDKLDSRSSLCRFIRYPKETAGYYFYDPSEQKFFVSRNAIFLEKNFPSNNRRDEVLLEESSEEPRHDNTTSFEPPILTDGVPVLRTSTRESRVFERYGFVGLTSQLDNDLKTY